MVAQPPGPKISSRSSGVQGRQRSASGVSGGVNQRLRGALDSVTDPVGTSLMGTWSLDWDNMPIIPLPPL